MVPFTTGKITHSNLNLSWPMLRLHFDRRSKGLGLVHLANDLTALSVSESSFNTCSQKRGANKSIKLF